MKPKINMIEIEIMGAGIGAYGTKAAVANVHIRRGTTYEHKAGWKFESSETFYRITKSSLVRAQRAQYKLITGEDMPAGETLTPREKELVTAYRAKQAEKVELQKFRSFAMKLAAAFEEFITDEKIDVCPVSWYRFLEIVEPAIELDKKKSDYLYEVISRILYGSPDRDDYIVVSGGNDKAN